MSKRAGAVSEETRAALVAAARDEFCELGYEKASLRSICANADVTTGALYFFFHSKEELFSEVLLPITKVVSSMSMNFAPIVSEDDYSSLERFTDFYYDNIDLYEIIQNNRDNAAVRDYILKLRAVFANQIVRIIMCSFNDKGTNYDKSTEMLMEKQIVIWCVDTVFQTVLQLVTLNLTCEEAKRHLITVVKLIKTGLFSVIE